MDHARFEHLVRRLELDSHASPAAFRRKVYVISVMAYVVLFAALGGLTALFVFSMRWALEAHRTFTMIKLGLFGLVLLPMIFVVLRMMFMRLDKPTGRPLTRAEAPKLFDVLDKLRDKLKGPPIHQVLLDDDYNAAICQHARFGIFGGHTNYLIVGLPFLIGSTPKEMLSVIAHEYGHLCGSHGKAAAWVYRQRQVFVGLYEKIEGGAGEDIVSTVLAAALQRFFPYYSAYTFVLSRQQEYEADRTAADMAGSTHSGQGLVRARLLGRWLAHEFWPRLYANADRLEQPPFLPYSAMRVAFKASYADWATKEALDAAWAERSDVDDTHPCLRDRLEAINAQPALPPVVDVPALDVLLASGTSKQLVAEFDEQWWRDNRKGWGERFRHVGRSQARIRELTEKPLEQLNVPSLQELAVLQMEFNGPAAARPVLEQQLKRPGGPYPKASMLFGRVLLAESNVRGLDYLRDAARHDASLVMEAAERGFHYFMEQKDEYAANQWWRSMVPEEAAA